MENNETNLESTSSPRRNSNLIYSLLGIIAVLVATNIFVYLKKVESTQKLETQTVQAKDDKATMQSELNKLESDLAASNSGNQKLTADLQQKDAELKSKISQLRRALNDKTITKAALAKAREEITELQTTVQKYTDDLATLKNENQQLTTANTQLKTTVDSVSQTSARLKSDNESLQKKVNTASALRTSNILIIPLKVNSDGKESPVTRAKKANKIRTTYTVEDNDLSMEGSHDVYLQVYDPSGKVQVSTNGGNFNTNAGESLPYTVKNTINYVKATKVYSIDWSTTSGSLVPGSYKVVLYADGYKMGENNFSLKKPGLF